MLALLVDVWFLNRSSIFYNSTNTKTLAATNVATPHVLSARGSAAVTAHRVALAGATSHRLERLEGLR